MLPAGRGRGRQAGRHCSEQAQATEWAWWHAGYSLAQVASVMPARIKDEGDPRGLSRNEALTVTQVETSTPGAGHTRHPGLSPGHTGSRWSCVFREHKLNVMVLKGPSCSVSRLWTESKTDGNLNATFCVIQGTLGDTASPSEPLREPQGRRTCQVTGALPEQTDFIRIQYKSPDLEKK